MGFIMYKYQVHVCTVIFFYIYTCQCYNANNVDLSGGVGDYPLCSIGLYADMDAAIDTPTCFRRGVGIINNNYVSIMKPNFVPTNICYNIVLWSIRNCLPCTYMHVQIVKLTNLSQNRGEMYL